MNFTDNDLILQAIQGVGATPNPTTLNTGTFDPTGGQQIGGQLPQMQDQLAQNPNLTGTVQRFFGTPSTSTFNTPQQGLPQQVIRHTPGRDSWSSGMGLDHQSILNNIGLGGQQ